MRVMNRGILKALTESYSLFAAMFIFLVAPAYGAPGDAHVTFILSNGLKVVVLPARSSHAVMVLRVGAGFIDEKPNTNPVLDETGVAHELEHALFRGTKRFPSKESFIAALNAMGARFNASTNFERTNYFLIVPSRALDAGLLMQSDMLAEPTLLSENLSSESRPVSEELLRNLTNPHFALYQYSLALHSENDRMRDLMASTPQQTLVERPDTIRAFYERYYSADNMQLAIVGDVGDLAKLRETLEKTYGRIRRFPTAQPQLVGDARREIIGGQIPLAFDGRLPLYRVRTPASGVRMLNVSFNLDDRHGGVQAATHLGNYLSRRGSGAILQKLYDLGLITTLNVSAESYRERTVVRFVMETTQLGEQQTVTILEKISSALGSIAKNGLPDRVVEELKHSHRITVMEGSGMLQVAEDLTESTAELGLDGVGKDIAAYLSTTGADIQNIAADMAPYRMELTALSSAVSATSPQVHGTPVDTVDLSSDLSRLSLAFVRGESRLDVSQNRFLRVDEDQVIRLRGLQVVVVPSAGSDTAEAVLRFALPAIPLTSVQSMSAYLAVMSFQLDPTNESLMRQVNEAGISLDYGLDLSENLFSVSVSGSAHAATLALTELLSALKTYKVSAEGLERARAAYIARIRAMPAVEVSRQALSLGMGMVDRATGASAPRQLFLNSAAYVAQAVAQANSADLVTAQQTLDLGRRRWAVTGVFHGNWSPVDLRTTLARIVPASARRPTPQMHSARLQSATPPELVVRDAEYDRQGVARFYPVDVARFSNEYWAFQVFAKILSARLDSGVRTERGMVYAISAGFKEIESGGSALYIAADSSRSATFLAMSYTTVFEHLISVGVTEAEIRWAVNEVGQQLSASSSGAEGIYSSVFEGLNVQRSALFLRSLDATRLMALVRSKIPALETLPESVSRRQLDAAVVGVSDPLCRRLLLPALPARP